MTNLPNRAPPVDPLLGTRHWSFLVTPDGPHGMPTLIKALERVLPHITPESWRARLAWGGVAVNGKPASFDQPLPFPCRLEYFEPLTGIEGAATAFPPFDTTRVLYDDGGVIGYAKPAGLPTLPSREQTRCSVGSYLAAYLGRPVHLPTRLDTATSGVVVASAHPDLHGALQRAFERRQVAKEYLLEVVGDPTWDTQEVTAPIARDPRHPVLRRVHEGGKAAHTTFEVVARCEGSCLLRAMPTTGRTHQIRVHATWLGHPIVGDQFYGGPEAEELHLVCRSLRLHHPRDGTPLVLQLPKERIPSWWLPPPVMA